MSPIPFLTIYFSENMRNNQILKLLRSSGCILKNRPHNKATGRKFDKYNLLFVCVCDVCVVCVCVCVRGVWCVCVCVYVCVCVRTGKKNATINIVQLQSDLYKDSFSVLFFNPFATGHIFCLRFGSKSGI